MNIQHRIDLLLRLREYILSDTTEWQEAREKAGYENGWFTPEFVTLALQNITDSFLQKDRLQEWMAPYIKKLPTASPKKIGVTMAGNIPLVGFHDFLSVYITGHRAVLKPSSKDSVLIKHFVEKIMEWEPSLSSNIIVTDQLKGCDAYIATGSNNSSRYFEYYFAKYPHIIRKNRTSVALLTGNETTEELEKLGDDVYTFFGLGCRNVSKIFVPERYDFKKLLYVFNKYAHLAEHHKYKNNYDYNLALHILNKKYYMTNGSILLIEDAQLFSPISQLNYSFYTSKDDVMASLTKNADLQCIVGRGFIPFGLAQNPSLTDYADGVDTVSFLTSL